MTFWKIEKGRKGENLARSILISKGMELLRANYRTRLGELDLVMRDGETVVFVEVKNRKDLAFGAPQESVTRAKQRRMVKTALWFLKERRLAGAPCRFDVVSLGPDGADHIPNAFQPESGNYTL